METLYKYLTSGGSFVSHTHLSNLVLLVAVLAGAFGALLGYSAIRFRVEGDPIAEQIDHLLPQSQCGQCGFPGCRPYAEAIASGEPFDTEYRVATRDGRLSVCPWTNMRPVSSP